MRLVMHAFVCVWSVLSVVQFSQFVIQTSCSAKVKADGLLKIDHE